MIRIKGFGCLRLVLTGGALNGGSGIQYFTGNFDGYEFVTIGEKTKWMDYGKDSYAGTTCQDGSLNNSRTLFICWMNNWQYANSIRLKAGEEYFPFQGS